MQRLVFRVEIYNSRPRLGCRLQTVGLGSPSFGGQVKAWSPSQDCAKDPGHESLNSGSSA